MIPFFTNNNNNNNNNNNSTYQSNSETFPYLETASWGFVEHIVEKLLFVR